MYPRGCGLIGESTLGCRLLNMIHIFLETLMYDKLGLHHPEWSVDDPAMDIHYHKDEVIFLYGTVTTWRSRFATSDY